LHNNHNQLFEGKDFWFELEFEEMRRFEREQAEIEGWRLERELAEFEDNWGFEIDIECSILG